MTQAHCELRNCMRLVKLVVLIAVVLASLHLEGLSARPEESEKSVVKIETVFADGRKGAASGFVWLKPTYVVTALHAVAASTSIEVYFETLNKRVAATLIKVHQEGDLALLEVDATDLQPLPKPIEVASAAPNLKEEHNIWGYPEDIPKMKGDAVRFSQTLKGKQRTLGDLFNTKNNFEKVVGNQGYPQFDTHIIIIRDTIGHGQSGAPVLDKDGAVVGIGAGGLYQGLRGLNWATPANYYLPLLESSKEDLKSVKPSKMDSHFGFTAMSPSTAKSTRESASGIANGELQLVGSAPLSNILSTALNDDAKESEALLKQAERDTGFDLGKEQIDVYEDDETGATIAVPTGFALTYHADHRLYQASSPNGRVTMYLQVAKTESKTKADEVRDQFDKYIDGLAKWQKDPQEDNNEEPEEGLQQVEKPQIILNEDGKIVGRMWATLIVDEDEFEFLGTAVVAVDYEDLTKDDLKTLLLMHVCVELAGFPIQ